MNDFYKSLKNKIRSQQNNPPWKFQSASLLFDDYPIIIITLSERLFLKSFKTTFCFQHAPLLNPTFYSKNKNKNLNTLFATLYLKNRCA